MKRLLILFALVTVTDLAAQPISSLPATNSIELADDFAINKRIGSTYQARRVAASNVVGSVIRINPSMSAAQITNLVGRTQPSTKVKISSGNYHIPTNTFTWARPGVDYDFESPVRFCWGSSGDGAARPSVFEFSTASTNRITGLATFVISNTTSMFADLQASGSRFELQASEVLRQLTAGSTPVIKVAANTTIGIDLSGDLHNWSYDGFYFPDAAGVRVLNFRIGGQILVEDTAIEIGGAFDAGFTPVFNVGTIDRRNSTANSAGLLSIGQNMVLNVGRIGGTGTNWWIALEGGAAGVGPAAGVLNCPYIKADATHVDNPHLFQAFTAGRWRIINSVIDGPTNRSAALLSLYGSQVSLEGCKLNLRARNSSVTNSAVLFDVGVGDEVLELKGTTFDAPVESQIFPKFYTPPSFVTNVNNTLSLVEGVTEVFVRTLASSGAKSIILTNATRYVRGHQVLVKDAAGTASNASSNLIVKAATGTVDGVAGATGKTISTDYGAFVFWCDGTNWWSR